MRPHRLLVPIAVAFATICAVTASAGPQKYEFHPGVCLFQNVASGGGGSSGTPHIEYSSMQITMRGANLNVICPLQHITFPDDPGASAYVIVRANVITPASGTSSCEFRAESATTFVSIPPAKFPPPNTADKIVNQGNMILPSLSTNGPVGFQFACTLAQDLKLGSIEVEID